MKRLVAMLVALSSLILAPIAAHAATHPASVAIHTEDDNGGSDDNGSGDSHSGVQQPTSGSYQGSDDTSAADKDDPFVVPPVAINPDVQKSSIKPIPGAHPKNLPPKVTSDNDAKSGRPINLPGMHPEVKTPVQQFVDTASIGLGAIAVGAATLGGAVLVRTIRNRKNGQKFDYFYGE